MTDHSGSEVGEKGLHRNGKNRPQKSLVSAWLKVGNKKVIKIDRLPLASLGSKL
jgi:hypothetical protein